MAQAVATAKGAERSSLLAAPEGRRARQVLMERLLLGLLGASSLVAILTTIGIALSLLFETVRFLDAVPLFDFLFGLNWSPQIAIREDQVGSSGAFGVVPLLVGTGLIAAVAMTVAGPLGLLSAIYLAEYASPRARSVAKPILEILAGIPTVVYGFFAVLVVAPVRAGYVGVGRLRGLVGKRARRRRGDGRDDRPHRLLARRRCDFRRAAVPARGRLRAGRD